MRALLVVNPNATTATVAARDALASELKLEVLETDHRGHARGPRQGAPTRPPPQAR